MAGVGPSHLKLCGLWPLRVAEYESVFTLKDGWWPRAQPPCSLPPDPECALQRESGKGQCQSSQEAALYSEWPKDFYICGLITVGINEPLSQS